MASRKLINVETRYGQENPHPLSQLRTELVWEGKYDEYGNRRDVDVAGLSMPLQKIETIDEPLSRAEAANDQVILFQLRERATKYGDFRNRLIWGDNKLVMASLLKEFAGRIDLIYIDPPFDVGADFSMRVPVGNESDTVQKDQSTLEMVAYRDIWGRGTDSYLQMIFERLSLMKSLLSEEGSLYLHCDWRVNALLRSVLDEIFGRDRHVNEIIWHYKTFQGQAHRYFAKKHDTLFLYSKSSKFTYQEQFDTQFEDTIDATRWSAYLNDQHQIVGARMPLQDSRFIRYLKKWRSKHGREPAPDDVVFDVRGQPVDSVWNIKGLDPKSLEKVDYATQKPEALLERIIATSTEQGDLVADFFCGSGTTGAVAERMGRRWIMADLGRFAIHTSRKRLMEVQRELQASDRDYRAFDVYNLGRYERQWWQRERLKGADDEHRSVVLGFYKAELLQSPPSPLLHARKGAALVHVNSIDSVLTRIELRQVADAALQAGARQVNCLAWEFEMDLRLEVHRLQAELGIEIRLVRIPREIMEKNRSHVTFFEVATLEAEPVYRETKHGRGVDIRLKNFLPSLAEVPEKELEVLQERAIERGFDFIDFWSIDFEYRDGEPFKHHWQAYRTRKDRTLPVVSEQRYVYERPGLHSACVKVVDTFGCDTSVLVPVEV